MRKVSDTSGFKESCYDVSVSLSFTLTTTTEMHAEILERTPHMASSYYAGTGNNAYRSSALKGEQIRLVYQMRLIPALFKNTSSALSKKKKKKKREREREINGRTAWHV
jgi:hypothetical protein